MGICHSRVVPYTGDSNKKARAYVSSIASDVVEAINKIRYTLATSKVLTSEMINTEGLLDFALVALHTSIITDQNSFSDNYKLYCVLLHHSSFIVTRLYASHVLQDEDCVADHIRVDTLRPLVRQALEVQDNTSLTWLSITLGLVPESNALYDIFLLFGRYCNALLNHLSHCSNANKLPPQFQYRTEVQPYDPSLKTTDKYASERKSIETFLTKLIALCGEARDSKPASPGQAHDGHPQLRSRRISSFVSKLAPLEE